MVVRLPDVKKYLNRDGLEEYNSLLPHSSAEIQEYVDDWLDAHPEATTTVQDGSITTQKLADDSVTRNKLAADVAHLLGGMMITGEVQGEILSASDAYSVAPLSMTIDGKSTQDGTPTPENPVPIDSIEVLELPVTFAGKNLFDKDNAILYNGYFDSLGHIRPNASFRTVCIPVVGGTTYTISRGWTTTATVWEYDVLPVSGVDGTAGLQAHVIYSAPLTFTTQPTTKYICTSLGNITQIDYLAELATLQLELGLTATAYEPYQGITVPIPMQGHVLRSLPDGTCDTMKLSYLRESDRAGWAWYSRELVQKLHEITLNTCAWLLYSTTAFYTRGLNLPFTAGNVEVLCNIFKASASKNLGGLANAEINSIQVLGRNELGIRTADEYQDAAAFVASLDDSDVAVVKLTTPVTTTLDPIELPVLPAPNCTIWSDPTTGLKMSYVRDANIVISDIEQAIADL